MNDSQHANVTPVRVIYGDTDAVFVRLTGSTVKHAIQASKVMCAKVTEMFQDPIKLNFEQVLYPSIFVQRKRYAGLGWVDEVQPKDLDIRGLETRNRGVPPVVANIMNELLSMILDKDRIGMSNEALHELRHRVKILMSNKIDHVASGLFDTSQFVLTRGLWMGTETEDYRGKQAHVELVQKLKKRDKTFEVREGERISYMFVKGTGKESSAGYEKAESLEYVLQNDIPLDYAYYIEHQLRKPLTRLLEHVLLPEEIGEIFKPRKLVQTISQSPAKGTITHYFKKANTQCLECKTRLHPTAKSTRWQYFVNKSSRETTKSRHLQPSTQRVISVRNT